MEAAYKPLGIDVAADLAAAELAITGACNLAFERGLISPKEYGAVQCINSSRGTTLKAGRLEITPASKTDRHVAGRMVYRLQQRYGLRTQKDYLVVEPIPTLWPKFLKLIGCYPVV